MKVPGIRKKRKVGDHLLFVPSEQAQVLLGQKEETIKVLVVWEGKKVLVPKWRKDKELRDWSEAKDILYPQDNLAHGQSWYCFTVQSFW